MINFKFQVFVSNHCQYILRRSGERCNSDCSDGLGLSGVRDLVTTDATSTNKFNGVFQTSAGVIKDNRIEKHTISHESAALDLKIGTKHIMKPDKRFVIKQNQIKIILIEFSDSNTDNFMTLCHRTKN